MNLVLFGNCQIDGLGHFLAKSPIAEQITITRWHNWRLVLLEDEYTPEFIKSVETADILIYQPTAEFPNIKGEIVPSTDYLLANHVKPGCIKISFAYIFNSGFFPILKVAEGRDGFITEACIKSLHIPDALTCYDEDRLHFNCARRFIECLAEQAKREQITDIKLADYILQNYRDKRLFLTQNHPTSELFVELTKRIVWRLLMSGVEQRDGIWNLKVPQDIPWTDINEANLPGALPVHPAVVRELGLNYGETMAEAPYDQYRVWLEELCNS